MEIARILFAFTAGVLSPLSPCSLPLLPSYVAYYLSSVEGGRIRGAMIIATTTLLGFLSVFMLATLVPSLALGFSSLWLKMFQPLFGVVLIFLGILLLRDGLYLSLHFHLAPPEARGVLSFFLFGITYALSSLSCSLPVFLLLVFASSGLGRHEVLLLYTSYALGCGVLFFPLCLAVSYSKDFIVEGMKKLSEYMSKIAASIFIATGLYMLLDPFFKGVWS